MEMLDLDVMEALWELGPEGKAPTSQTDDILLFNWEEIELLMSGDDTSTVHDAILLVESDTSHAIDLMADAVDDSLVASATEKRRERRRDNEARRLRKHGIQKQAIPGKFGRFVYKTGDCTLTSHKAAMTLCTRMERSNC